MVNYRKFWEKHNGPIPIDEDGVTYEIHHIDGNRSNNCIDNLQCISIQEHYDIHYLQGNYGACFKIAVKHSLDKHLLSELSSKRNIENVKNGTHPWLKKNGYDIVRRNYINSKIKDGTFHMLKENGGDEICRKIQIKRVNDKTHNFLGSAHNMYMLQNNTHPSQHIWHCTICDKTGKGKGNSVRYHSKCKEV